MDDSFSVFSAVAYTPIDSTPFPLLQRHYKRLHTAFNALAKEIPDCWCTKVQFPSEEMILKELWRCVEAGGKETAQRIRLLILENGKPDATSVPLVPAPSYPMRLILDTAPTDYSTPFLRYKTTKRDVYDQARARTGATLIPSSESTSPPFDVLLYNDQLEMTETSIANCAFCLNPTIDPKFFTPPTSCGLLEGVQRAELLENGTIEIGVVLLSEVKAAIEAKTLVVLCFNAIRGVYKGYVL